MDGIMRLTLDLVNCYGINNLQQEFDFRKSATNNGVNSLYAPNGTLKTSLAKTFKDIEEGNTTTDLIFPQRVTKREIKIDDNDIIAEQVMVIESYNESYSSRQVSTLLVNDTLKQQYDTALREVDDKRSTLLKALAKLSGKREVVALICEVLGIQEKSLLETLVTLQQQPHPDYTDFSQFKFGDLFNPKVTELLASEGFNQDLTEYVDTYDKLIQQSAVLSKTFNHQKAGAVSKSLSETGFFTASHSVNMSIRGVKQEVTTREQLNQLLQDEQDKVLQSPELKEKFSRVDSKLNTKDTQVFRDFIAEHQTLLTEYQNLERFKMKVLLGYLQTNQAFWDDLIATYKQNQELVANIIHQAQQQKTIWESVVNTFNKRFRVPFRLTVDNQDEVILNGAAPAIKFEFSDGRSTGEVSKQNLLKVLSQGEKRALYILNLLFEIETRLKNTQSILIVIDDIADSFDYKNKYAIVEYLRDIAKIEHFNLLLLTHNFDFHRIVSSRLGAKRQNRHVAIKSAVDIKIKQERYQKDVFNTWKIGLATNEQYLLASIPFARNIADYCGHNDHSVTLTSLLHYKADTRQIKFSDLQTLYREIFTDLDQLVLPDANEVIVDKIYHQCLALVANNNESPDLESKVILAMGIRLKAETFMIAKISDPEFVNQVTSNQTRELFDKYKELNATEHELINLLDQVNLMTPENIHLNSFMYEPILDMSAHSLYQLYSDINALI